MRRTSLVTLTAAAVLVSSLLPPAALATGDGNRQRVEGEFGGLPGIDENGNLTSEGELGSLFVTSLLNTKSGKGILKGRGLTPNLSAKRQKYRDDGLAAIAIILAFATAHGFSVEEVTEAFLLVILIVNPKGKSRATAKFEFNTP